MEVSVGPGVGRSCVSLPCFSRCLLGAFHIVMDMPRVASLALVISPGKGIEAMPVVFEMPGAIMLVDGAVLDSLSVLWGVSMVLRDRELSGTRYDGGTG